MMRSDLDRAEYDDFMSPPSRLPTHFSPHQPLQGAYNPVPHASALARRAHSQEAALEAKLDQMMGMISSTQQMLMEQATATKKLEKTVEEMGAEIKGVKKELDEVTGESPKELTKRSRLPTQLSVS